VASGTTPFFALLKAPATTNPLRRSLLAYSFFSMTTNPKGQSILFRRLVASSSLVAYFPLPHFVAATKTQQLGGAAKLR
jgi:hypothetical protein